MNVGLGVGFFVAIIFAAIEIIWIACVGIILMLASLIQAFIFYKCPNCNKLFNIRGKKPKYCLEFGYKLDN